jgi:hypothetical protein
MRGMQLGRRLDRIASIHSQIDVRRIAGRLVAVTGIPEDELMTEAARVAERCQHLGITTVEEMICTQAGELGTPVEELAAEMERIQELVA